MNMICKVTSCDQEVNARLKLMDLSVAGLGDVIKDIDLVINSMTADHPSWGKGITIASEAVASLRSRFRGDGWTKQEEKGFALTVHPDGLLAINIAKGDIGTGDKHAEVISVSDKGICTEIAVQQNQYCFDFMAKEDETQDKMQTWYLLYCKKDDGIHAELSLPVGFSDTMHLSIWRERIILPIIKSDPEFEELTTGFDDGGFGIKLSKK